MSPASGRRAGLALTLIVASAWLLAAPLAHALPLPPLTNPKRWRAWLDQSDPLTAAATLFRIAALIGCALVALGLFATIAGLLSDRARGWSRLLPGPVLTIAVLILGTAGCAPNGTTARSGAALRPAPHARTVTMTRLMSDAMPPAVASVSEAARPDSPPAPPTVWRVQSGQSLWLIAAATVQARRGGAPVTVSEVATYWRNLIYLNRDRLARPDDPSLIFSGQDLILPPP